MVGKGGDGGGRIVDHHHVLVHRPSFSGTICLPTQQKAFPMAAKRQLKKSGRLKDGGEAGRRVRHVFGSMVATCPRPEGHWGVAVGVMSSGNGERGERRSFKGIRFLRNRKMSPKDLQGGV